MIFLTFGTGLGAGMILDGRLYNGTNGNAGEVGHIDCTGSVRSDTENREALRVSAVAAKTAAIEQLRQRRSTLYCKSFSDLDSVTARSVAEAADAGDETALEVYSQCGEMLGYGLSVLVDILNPQKIIFGSIFKRAHHLLKEPMMQVMKKECLSSSLNAVEILPAALGEEIGDKAALALAMSL